MYHVVNMDFLKQANNNKQYLRIAELILDDIDDGGGCHNLEYEDHCYKVD